MKKYYGYIRVSTAKQGDKGSSLQEQKSAIEGYAKRHDLLITEWFEERETAAKLGRPIFMKMMKALQRGSADGVIIHKIDRSARNLKDWSALGELADRGIDLRFVQESIDLTSDAGRLSADVLAVVAANYVRNLRAEVKKGFYGRLKQGFFPLQAPIGYLDRGGGVLKAIDPVRGPLIAQAFALYATGNYSLETLRHELTARGLRVKRGGAISKNSLSCVLTNPFYIGIIKIKRTGETFKGSHEPLISKPLFDRVQAALHGKAPYRSTSHQFRYQRTIRCRSCNLSLIGERQKGHVYYRCHTRDCPTTSLRETAIDAVFRNAAVHTNFSTDQWKIIESDIEAAFADTQRNTAQEKQTLSLAIAAIDDRMARLTDAFVDQVIDKATYLERKERLLHERAAVEAKKDSANNDVFELTVRKNLELLKSLQRMPDLANDHDLRDLLKNATSNFSASGKSVDIKWEKPFDSLFFEGVDQYGGLNRIKARTKYITETLIQHARDILFPNNK